MRGRSYCEIKSFPQVVVDTCVWNNDANLKPALEIDTDIINHLIVENFRHWGIISQIWKANILPEDTCQWFT